MSLEEVQILFTAMSIILVAIQAYLVYKVNKAKLALETFVSITEKSELTISPKIKSEQLTIIELANSGLIPIDELEAKLDMTISQKEGETYRFI